MDNNNQDDLITSDDPQAELAARGMKQGAQMIANSSKVQQAMNFNQNLNNYNDMVQAAMTGNEQANLALANHSAGIAMGTIAPIEGAVAQEGAQMVEGLAPKAAVLPEATQNALTTQQVSRKLYRDEVAKANKASRSRFAEGGMAGMDQGEPDSFSDTYAPVMLADGGSLQGMSPEDTSGSMAAPHEVLPIMTYADGGQVPEGLDEFLNSKPIVDNQDKNQTIGTQSGQVPEGLDEFLGDESPRAQKYGTLGQQAITGLEGAAEGIAGPLATGAETALGVNPEDIRQRREENPVSHGVGQVAGLAGSMATGLGEGALAVKAGEMIAPKVAETVAAKMGSAAVKAAVENMVIQSGDEASKMIINDPNQTGQSAIADIGLSGVLGGALGGAAGGIGGLWKAKFGNKIGDIAADFKGRMEEHYASPDQHASITDELTNQYNNIRQHADEVFGPNGLKAQDVEKALPEVNPHMITHSQKVADDMATTLEKMRKKPNNYPERLVSKLEDDVNAYRTATQRPDVTAAELFNGAQDLKQQLQSYAKYDKFVKPVDEAYDFIRDSKQLAHSLRESLEDSKIFGKAADRQKTINKAFTEYLPSLKDFERKFTVEVGGERQIDPGKVATFIKQADKASGEVKKSMLNNFLDASDKYRKVISETHHNLGIDSPVEHTSLNSVKRLMQDKSLGAKLAEYFIDKGNPESITGTAKGALAGSALGSLLGHPHLGALIGSGSAAHAFNSALPGLIKPLIMADASGLGLKAAVDYAMSAVKGDNLAGKAVKSLFKVSQTSVASIANRDSRSREKLDKQLKELLEDQKPMMDVGKDLGHYMPEHNSALASTSMNAVNYLNSLRPNSVKQAPLDRKLPPSRTAQSRYNQALDIANDPLSVIDKVKDGTITPQNLMDFKTMYPSLYTGVSTKIMTEMSDHLSKGEDVPYKTRLGLSMFLGQPMDSTISPQSILAAQPQPKDDQPQSPQGSSPKAKGSKKALNKSPGQYRTPSQNRELTQQTKD